MIIHNMNDKSMPSLCKLLTNYEKNIFNLFLPFFNNNKIEEIDKFVEFTKALDFYKDDLTILNLEADKLYIDLKIKKYIRNKDEKNKKELETFNNNTFKNEKEKFQKINYFTVEIEQNEIIKLYDNLIQKIEDIFIADKATKEKIELEKMYNDLLDKIKKIHTNNKNILHYKDSLIQQLKFTKQNEEYDKDEYNMYNDKYHQLKKQMKILRKKIMIQMLKSIGQF